MVRKIRVLIVEDTKVGQGLLKGILAEDSRFDIVGFAGDGAQAVEMVKTLNPDVVSMDIYMPVMDGVVATKKIMQTHPVPIVIVSSLYNPGEIKMSFKILEAGAITILAKPFGPGHPQYTQTARVYRSTLKMISEIKVSLRKEPRIAITSTNSGDSLNRGKTITPAEKIKIIAIGASAGGPLAIQTILSKLPSNLPVPVLIVQHIDLNFADGFCEWLSSVSALPVQIAKHGETIVPGHVYLPPGDHHLGALREGILAVTKDPQERGLRPAVGYLFRKIADFYGNNAMGILLSGMGADGAIELKLLHDKGAWTIAQDAASSLVHGMPGEAIKIGAASMVLSPDEIVTEINKIFML